MTAPLLRFVALAGVLIAAQLPFALVRRDQVTVTRSITLLAILGALALALAFGRPGFAVLCGLIVLLGSREIERSFALGGLAVSAYAVLAAMDRMPQTLAWAPVAITIVALVGGQRALAASWFGPALVLLLIVPGAAGLAHLVTDGTAAQALGLLLLVQLNDAVAYLVGSRIGRWRPFPTISPNKSLEGYAAGALALCGGIALLHTPILALRTGRSLGADVWLFAYVLLAANGGDLLFSAIKRSRAIKDFGTLLPGHGGVLDRFGNFLLAAALFPLVWAMR